MRSPIRAFQMITTDIIILVIRVLAATFMAVCILASLFVFRTPNEKGKPEIPPIAWLPFLDIIWALVAPIIHWRENPKGRLCLYGFLASALALAATFLVK